MRIRKRAVPFPLSSLLPGPISDPLINHSRPSSIPAAVQLNLGGPSSSSPDRPICPVSAPINGCDFSDKGDEEKNSQLHLQDCSELVFQESEEGEKKEIKGNDNLRNDVNHQNSSALSVSGSNTSPELSNLGGKKRRGSARGRGPLEMMEGSRCSRVNGRGWRCCQQTLVGYSLCEHHLGKGRLRTIATRINNNNSNITLSQSQSQSSSSSLPPRPISTDKGSSLSSKKRTKLGTVKARSMSSLLGQTTNSSTTSAITGENDHTYMSS